MISIGKFLINEDRIQFASYYPANDGYEAFLFVAFGDERTIELYGDDAWLLYEYLFKNSRRLKSTGPAIDDKAKKSPEVEYRERWGEEMPF